MVHTNMLRDLSYPCHVTTHFHTWKKEGIIECYCSSVVLQRDRMIKRGIKIHCLLEKWLKLWQEKRFDLLIQGTVQYNYSVYSTNRRSHDSKDYILKLLYKFIYIGGYN